MRRTRNNRNAIRIGALASNRTLPARELAFWLIACAGLVLALAALALPAAAATEGAETDAYAYGFVSRVEGDALLLGVDVDDAIDAEINHPLLTGDQINTNSGRIELVLPDGTVVRVAPGTVVIFDALAGAPDSELEDGTFVSLDQGELQIRTPDSFFQADDLAVQTVNATLYLAASGSYRVSTQGASFTEVVVREGFAEADTSSGSEVARVGEALEISGNARPFVRVVAAGPADSLELWAGDLDQLAAEAIQNDVDPRLAYAAAPLADAGEWVEVESRRAWRPYVRADWRPYRYGRWVYTPSGLTWVASAPWGWVTSHYGFWDYVPGYGWLWLPGNVYTPAGVYWYWGPTHVAWIPYGYYNRYGRGGYGIYGWAGGSWGYWSDWTFCPTRYFGRRGYDTYWSTGQDLERERRYAVPRGIVTTDTRGLRPDSWGKPSEALDRLVRRVDAEGRGANLPDVTDFVARRRGADAMGEGAGSRFLDRKASTRARLQPLPEEELRGRFRGGSVADRRGASSEPRVRSVAGTRGLSGGVEDRTVERTGRLGERATGAEGSTRGISRVDPGGRGVVEPPSSRVRSVGDRRIDPRSRSVLDRRATERRGSSSLDRSSGERGSVSERPPARRVLDRIRAHRETSRGSASRSSGARARGSEGDSRGAAKSGSSGSSSGSSRGSGSSASSGSQSGSVQKASPPSRSTPRSPSRGNSSRSRSGGDN